MPVFGHTRPYPVTELTTDKWLREVPVEAVALDALCFTQDGVTLKHLLAPDHGPDPYPHVVLWHGRLYLENGHSRVARALIRGTEVAYMRVFRVPDDV